MITTTIQEKELFNVLEVSVTKTNGVVSGISISRLDACFSGYINLGDNLKEVVQNLRDVADWLAKL